MGAFDSLSSLLSLSCELGENNQQNKSTFMSCAKNQKLERPRTEIIVEVLEMTNMKFKKCQRYCASSFSFTALHLAARKSRSVGGCKTSARRGRRCEYEGRGWCKQGSKRFAIL